MTLHANKRLWQRHVLAENRRSIEGLLETLCAEPVDEVMATGERHVGRPAVAASYRGLFDALPDVTIVFPIQAGQILGERLNFDLDSLHRQLGLR